MLIVETWRPLVPWSPKDDAHTWLRSDDRRAMRPTGRVEYSYNGVQEIVGGTIADNSLLRGKQFGAWS